MHDKDSNKNLDIKNKEIMDMMLVNFEEIRTYKKSILKNIKKIIFLEKNIEINEEKIKIIKKINKNYEMMINILIEKNTELMLKNMEINALKDELENRNNK